MFYNECCMQFVLRIVSCPVLLLSHIKPYKLFLVTSGLLSHSIVSIANVCKLLKSTFATPFTLPQALHSFIFEPIHRTARKFDGK